MSEYDPTGTDPAAGDEGWQDEHGYDVVAAEQTDGSVAYFVDTDHDGVADIVAYDTDGDGDIDKAWVDTDGDGRLDTLYVDHDGDGNPDAVYADTNGDGRVDVAAFDRDHDGRIDAMLVDADYDGHADVLVTDSDRDGTLDTERYLDNDTNPYAATDLDRPVPATTPVAGTGVCPADATSWPEPATLRLSARSCCRHSIAVDVGFDRDISRGRHGFADAPLGVVDGPADREPVILPGDRDLGDHQDLIRPEVHRA